MMSWKDIKLRSKKFQNRAVVVVRLWFTHSLGNCEVMGSEHDQDKRELRQTFEDGSNLLEKFKKMRLNA